MFNEKNNNQIKTLKPNEPFFHYHIDDWFQIALGGVHGYRFEHGLGQRYDFDFGHARKHRTQTRARVSAHLCWEPTQKLWY